MIANGEQLPNLLSSTPEYCGTAGRPAGKVAIHTHGCKLNQADSSVLARQFRSAGYEVVTSVADADIFVLNTCTVTAEADSKARQALRAARRANPDAIVVAAGCYPQRAAQDLADMPAVSLVVDNEDKANLASLAAAAHRAQTGTDTAHWDRQGYSEPRVVISGNLPGRSRAMVKIQEGCDQVCAYCIVPRVRGRERSIPPEEIVAEVNRRISEGCVEVSLTGTQLGTYGFDLPGANLKQLIRKILTETGVTRLRVSSLQPQEIDSGLLKIWLEDDRLCPHFHIPLQSGTDTILKAMRRRYTTRLFSDTVEEIRQSIPDAGITADLIVGFPGESEREFENSLAFVRDMEFSDLHVFPYSKRPGTSAAHFQDQVPGQVKKPRVGRALEAARDSFEKFRCSQLQSVRPVLWEGGKGQGDNKRVQGLTDNYIRVELTPGYPVDQAMSLANRVTPAMLTDISGKAVVAEPV